MWIFWIIEVLFGFARLDWWIQPLFWIDSRGKSPLPLLKEKQKSRASLPESLYPHLIFVAEDQYQSLKKAFNQNQFFICDHRGDTDLTSQLKVAFRSDPDVIVVSGQDINTDEHIRMISQALEVGNCMVVIGAQKACGGLVEKIKKSNMEIPITKWKR